MSDQRRKEKNREKEKGEKGAGGQMPQVVDALRHVGLTLEQDERYLAVERNELPENIIAERGLVEATPHPDPYEREAEAWAPSLFAPAFPATPAPIPIPTWVRTAPPPSTRTGSEIAVKRPDDRRLSPPTQRRGEQRIQPRSLPPADSSARTTCCDQPCTSSSRSVRSCD